MLHFHHLANVDVAPIIAAVKPAMFHELTFRQDAPGTAHRDTESIYLRMPATISYHSMFEEIETVDYPADDAFRASIEAPPMRVIADGEGWSFMGA